ncbi:MAG: sigma-70 family RNA polymerase sigma factor [Bryobacteraceae bacterium]
MRNSSTAFQSTEVKEAPIPKSLKNKWEKLSDPEVVSRCVEGDQEAWRCIVHRYRNLVYSIPARYHLQPADAADIFQDVWLALYRELPQLREAGALRYWLATATVRRCLRVKSRVQREEELQDTMTGTSVEQDVLDVLRDQAVRDAIAALPARCQTIIKLLFFEHPPLSYREIANRLHLAEGSIGFIRGRCLKKLLDLLKEKGF